MKRILTISFLLLIHVCALAQTWSVSGIVLNKKTGEPVEYATVILERTEQWAVADEKGRFTISKVQEGTNIISVSCLGFVTDTKEISITRDIENFKVSLSEDNLALDGATVTAKEKDNTATTSRMIDKTALDHVQMMNVADISGLIPGGATVNPDLTAEQTFDIRAGIAGSETGNSSFGTAVEVDGIRLSNNASFTSVKNSVSGVKGVSTNNIASSNVESVEVITGVPSVEYGDMTSGVVKINTRKGATDYIVTASTNPRTKQVSASKGFNLGESARGRSKGILNANIEYTKAVSDRMSPYTAYDRKQLSLIYSNTFNKGIFADTPLQFSAGVTGNLGGMDSKADPDKFLDTFEKGRDNAVRGNISFNWLLSKSWITNVELNASAVYADKQTAVRKNYSNSASTPSMHGREEGYFVAQDYIEGEDQAVVLIPRGYWYNTMCIDDRPLNYKVTLKANWAKQWGKVNNKIKIGADWTGDGNFGIGEYSEDLSNAPSFREYRYDQVPFMNNIAAYIEDNILIPLGNTKLNIIAGVRNDNTMIKGSAYGTTSSLSPRFNAKYTVFSPKGRKNRTIRELTFRGSWGMAVKQPSFSVLFPTPSYRDILTFTPTSDTEGKYYPAYFISPRTIEYNPDLKWQRSRQSEIGMEIDIKGYRISLAAFYNTTFDAYRMHTAYYPFSYNFTSAQALQSNCTIPVADRIFEVDRKTGQVTVHDRSGAHGAQQIPYTVKNGLNYTTYAANHESPINRYGFEWIVDFRKIESINTSIRLDGTYYGYRNISTDVIEYSPQNVTGADGEPYKYVGLYYGSDSYSNGNESQAIKTNLTVTTQIPKVRMIISVKLQATLLNYSRVLSEKADGSARSHMLSNRSDILSTIGGSVYDGNGFAVTYPEYYTTADNPEVRKNYLADLKWAKENDMHMYNDLSRLAFVNNFIWQYGQDYISPYFSANISVTKEIGDLASISFYANNFFNNMGQVKSSKTGNYTSLGFNQLYIPGFFYGLTVRLKF
jgi:outer membrane receptor protein involved in Fe transport